MPLEQCLAFNLENPNPIASKMAKRRGTTEISLFTAGTEICIRKVNHIK